MEEPSHRSRPKWSTNCLKTRFMLLLFSINSFSLFVCYCASADWSLFSFSADIKFLSYSKSTRCSLVDSLVLKSPISCSQARFSESNSPFSETISCKMELKKFSLMRFGEPLANFVVFSLKQSSDFFWSDSTISCFSLEFYGFDFTRDKI